MISLVDELFKHSLLIVLLVVLIFASAEVTKSKEIANISVLYFGQLHFFLLGFHFFIFSLLYA